MKSLKFLALSIMVGSVLAFATACGADKANENKTEQNGAAGDEAKQLEGDVPIDGSSTVLPIQEALAEDYKMEQENVNVTVGGGGSGAGFEKLIAEEIVIADASRPIKDTEKAALEEKGIEYTEFKIANDGLSIVVNKDNDWVKELTVEQLTKIWSGDGNKKWSDIDPSWPKEEIKFFSPGHDSGTFDYFSEVVLEEGEIEMVKGDNVMLSEDDNTLVKGVEGTKGAIGYFGFAYYQENKDKLKVIPIVSEEGKAVKPTPETIEDGSYNPFSRPLYMYVKNDALKEEQVYDYMKFALENAGDYAEEVGYVRLKDEMYDEALKTLEGLK